MAVFMLTGATFDLNEATNQLPPNFMRFPLFLKKVIQSEFVFVSYSKSNKTNTEERI